MSQQATQKVPPYFLNPPSLVALAVSFSPLLLLIYPFLPGYSITTIVMTVFTCLMTFLALYMLRRDYWELELLIKVRGVRAISLRTMAQYGLLLSFCVLYILLMDIARFVPALVNDPILARMILRPMQILAFWGLSLFFSATALLDYMQKTDKEEERPAHLRKGTDLVDLAIGRVKADLRIPAEEPYRIIERTKLPGGGLRFVISWNETVQKTVPNGEPVRFSQEHKYEVEVDCAGKITSLKAKT